MIQFSSILKNIFHYKIKTVYIFIIINVKKVKLIFFNFKTNLIIEVCLLIYRSKLIFNIFYLFDFVFFINSGYTYSSIIKHKGSTHNSLVFIENSFKAEIFVKKNFSNFQKRLIKFTNYLIIFIKNKRTLAL